MIKKYLWGLSVLIEAIIIYLFYDTNERIAVYITVIILFILLNSLFVIFKLYFKHKDGFIKSISISTIVYASLTLLLFLFSYFQFNYAIMPYDFSKSDPMYLDYKYSDLLDDIQIEYYARDYQGEDSIFRASMDKNEIKEFLKFFRNLETINTDELAENPDVYIDWHEDIHVMLRNMDPDGIFGYYIFHIDLVDSSIYALKSVNSVDGTVIVYEVPNALRQFIIEHLLME